MAQEMTIDSLTESLWAIGATDMHLSAGMIPLMRVDGDLHPMPGQSVLTPTDVEMLVRSLLTERQYANCIAGKDTDFSFGWQGKARIRGNAFRQRNTVALALRLMPRDIPSFDELRLPETVRNFARLKQGLVLVTGPTGSGKSTTLASLIDWIATHRAVHVITIEDPIEYLYHHRKSAVNQRAVGEDTVSFAAALRSALREDPDVILVGELRDLESIRFALTLAETGHLVFATVHTNDTSQTVDRIVEVFPGDEQSQVRTQLSIALTAVVHQRLLPKLGGGLVAAYEVLVVNAPLRNLIKEGKSGQLRNQIMIGQRDGMMTLEESLNRLVAEGAVTVDQAIARSRYPREIVRR